MAVTPERADVAAPANPDEGTAELLRRTAELAIAYRESLPNRPVAPAAGYDELAAVLGGPLPETGEDPNERLLTNHTRGQQQSRPANLHLGPDGPTQQVCPADINQHDRADSVGHRTGNQQRRADGQRE